MFGNIPDEICLVNKNLSLTSKQELKFDKLLKVELKVFCVLMHDYAYK